MQASCKLADCTNVHTITSSVMPRHSAHPRAIPRQHHQERVGLMAETGKLSVQKALENLRKSEASKTKNERLDEKFEVLDEEIKRMRAQRLRLEQRPRKPT